MSKEGKVNDNQESLFNDASGVVKRHAFYMRRALDDKNLDDALVKAANMISELRTSKLYPSKYYELYMNITNELRALQEHIVEQYQRLIDKSTEATDEADEWLEELYERVQYRANIVPRLYLLVTVGSVKLKVTKEPASQIVVLYDLVEMTKGVQHPTRGLFLRNYLSSVSREHLPDIDDVHEERDDNVRKAIDFVLQNFSEMARLWIRMQHQGAVRNKKRRERERKQLQMLVGTNLKRLSELTSVDIRTYKDHVLPEIVKQVVKGKDRIAQEYLMDCIIHVFTDEYHLATLDVFLKTCSKLHSSVNVRTIIESLMNRLAAFAAENPSVFGKEDVFPKFQECCKAIIAKPKSKMKLQDLLSLQCALVNFAAQCYPGEDKYIAEVIKSVYEILSSKGEKAPPEAVDHVNRAITAPLGALKLKVFEIEDYPKLITFLDIESQRQVARSIAEELAQTEAMIGDRTQASNLFALLASIVKEQSGSPRMQDDHKDQFEDEMVALATVINLIRNPKAPDQHYDTLQTVWKEHLSHGGKVRIGHVAPPVVFNALALIQSKYSATLEDEDEARLQKKKRKKIFQFVYKVLESFAAIRPYEGIRIYTQAALATSFLDMEAFTYEFLSSALVLYEEEISDSVSQYDTILLLTATIQKCNIKDEENFDALRTKCAQHSSKLLKKPSQVKAMCACVHLFWDTKWRDEEIVSKLLQRSCKYSTQTMDEAEKIHLYLDILNKYLYLHNAGMEKNTVELIQKLLNIVKEDLGDLDQDSPDDEEGLKKLSNLKTYYRNTMQYIKDLKVEVS